LHFEPYELSSKRTFAFDERCEQQYYFYSVALITNTAMRSQFHQLFMNNFFVQKCFTKLFSPSSLGLKFFGKMILAQKLLVKCWWNWLQVTLYQHFTSSFLYKSVLCSFYVLTFLVCNCLAKWNWRINVLVKCWWNLLEDNDHQPPRSVNFSFETKKYILNILTLSLSLSHLSKSMSGFSCHSKLVLAPGMPLLKFQVLSSKCSDTLTHTLSLSLSISHTHTLHQRIVSW